MLQKGNTSKENEEMGNNMHKTNRHKARDIPPAPFALAAGASPLDVAAGFAASFSQGFVLAIALVEYEGAAKDTLLLGAGGAFAVLLVDVVVPVTCLTSKVNFLGSDGGAGLGRASILALEKPGVGLVVLDPETLAVTAASDGKRKHKQ